MLSAFDDCYEAVLEREGGFKLHLVEDDRGGFTYGGLTERWFPDALDWHRLKEVGDQPEFREAVKAVMKSNFWDALKCDDAPEWCRDAIYDFSVNAGVKTCVKIVQKIVGTKADGIIGSKTLAALSAFDPSEFHSGFFDEKMNHYHLLCELDPSQDRFIAGWTNRAEAVRNQWEDRCNDS